MIANFLQFFFGFPLKVLIVVTVFTIPLNRRRFFWPRIVFASIIYIMMFYFVPLSSYLYNVVLFAFSVIWILFCFKSSLYSMIFCAVGAYAGQNISQYFFRIVQIIFFLSADGILGIIVSTAICVAVAAVCYFFLVRRVNYAAINLKSVVLNSIIILGLTIICSENIPVNNELSTILYYVYAIASCFLTLYVQYGLFQRNELKLKNMEIEQILYAERKQQRLSQQSINMVNLRCHDLKHYLKRLTDVGGNEQIVRDLKETIEEYDKVINTGIEALDTVLTEKNFTCHNYGVMFSYIVDGGKLMFMNDTDIYSLFGNVLDNAIEAVKEVDAEKRIISLSVTEQKGYVHIHAENYCEKDLRFSNGIPLTSKPEGLHGYGTRSIKYISEKYGGRTTMEFKNNWFYLDVLMPITEQVASKNDGLRN